MVSPELSEKLARLAAEEAIEQAGIGRKGDFPGRSSSPFPPVEIEWTQRDALAEGLGRQRRDRTMTIWCGWLQPKFGPFYERFKFGSVAEQLAEHFGTKGSPISLSTACASGATAIQLGVEAIRRGETDAALCDRHRRLGHRGIADPLLAAVGAVDARTIRRRRRQAVLQEPRRLRDGRRRRRAGAGKPTTHAVARGAKILGVIEGCGEMADNLPPHPLEPGRQADHRLHPQCARRCRR